MAVFRKFFGLAVYITSIVYGVQNQTKSVATTSFTEIVYKDAQFFPFSSFINIQYDGAEAGNLHPGLWKIPLRLLENPTQGRVHLGFWKIPPRVLENCKLCTNRATILS